MNAREEIYRRIRSALAPQQETKLPHAGPATPLHVEDSHDGSSRIDRFVASIERSGGVAIVFDGLEEWFVWLDDYLTRVNCRSLFVDLPVSAAPLAHDVIRRLSKSGIEVTSRSDFNDEKDSRALHSVLAQIDAGVTMGLAGLVDSGAVLISTSTGETRASSLLPPIHICLLDEETLIERMHAALPVIHSLLQESSPSAMVFIGGPSRTADIEKVLVTGVHGPKHFIVSVLRRKETDGN